MLPMQQKNNEGTVYFVFCLCASHFNFVALPAMNPQALATQLTTLERQKKSNERKQPMLAFELISNLIVKRRRRKKKPRQQVKFSCFSIRTSINLYDQDSQGESAFKFLTVEEVEVCLIL